MASIAPDGEIKRIAGPRQAMRAKMDEGSRLATLRGSRALLFWNFFSLILVFVPMMLPASDLLAQNLRYIMFNAVLCTTFTWWRLGVPVRLIWPIRFVMLLQIWLTICSYMATSQLGRTNDFETSNYFLVMAIIYYFNVAVINYVWHEYRTWFFRWLLFFFGVSAFIGFLQFLKVPPALALANLYNSSNSIAAWGANEMGEVAHGAGSIRAIGLGSWPEWLAFHGMLGWSILAARLFERKLKTWEFLLASFFLLSAFTSQSRIMYLSLIVCTFTFLYLLIRRDRERGALYLASFVGLLLLLFSLGAQRLSYVLQTDLANDQTLQYRQEVGWQQAYQIMAERPWTGIGPDDGLVWSVTRIDPDRWTQGQFVDNGFLLLLSWGGLPALALYLPIIISGLMSAVFVAMDRRNSMSRRQAAMVAGLAIGLILNNMLLNNGFTNIWMNCVIASIAAMALPNSAERVEELQRRFHIKRNRKESEIEYAKMSD